MEILVELNTKIGELSTSSGTYRTYVYAKNKMGTWLIQEIRFEKN
ncbi:MAG: DUF4783 domain-containing protein [Chitinophagales bacterium]